MQRFRGINSNLLHNISKSKEGSFFRKVIPRVKLSTDSDFRSNKLDVMGKHENLERK